MRRQTMGADYFCDLYARDADPWKFERDHFVAYLSAGDPSLIQIKAPQRQPFCELSASMHGTYVHGRSM
jgi:hypothetical protein